MTMCVWFRYAQLAVQYVGNTWFADVLAVPNWAYAAVVAVCAVVSALFFWERSPRLALGLLIAIFFTCSLTLNAVWYGCTTFTIRDEARALVGNQQERPFLIGTLCYEMAMENRSLPICDPWIPWLVTIPPFNAWFAEECDRNEFLVLVDDTNPNAPINAGWRAILARTSPERIQMVKHLQLWPNPIIGGYRYHVTLYRVMPNARLR
jgi:hypothetical protein